MPAPHLSMSPRPVALVTGGAGGVGAAVSRTLASQGYAVVVADIDEAAATQVASEVGGSPVRVDVSDPEQNRTMVAHTLDQYARLDLLVLNAGVNSGQVNAEPLDLSRYRRTNGINVDGVVFGIDAALAALRVRGGAIVVTSSLASLLPEQANAVYALGKAAVVGYVRAMAAPLAKLGVRINVLCPSFVDTPMLGAGRAVLHAAGYPLISPQDYADGVLAVLHSAQTGAVWPVVANRPVLAYEFPGVFDPLLPDGSAAPTLTLG